VDMTLKTVDGIICIKLLPEDNNKIAACDLMFRTTPFIRVSEWLLYNDNPAIFHLYHGENKLNFNAMMMRPAFVLDQHA